VRAPESVEAPAPGLLSPAALREAARIDLVRYLAACYYEPSPAFQEERLFDSMQACAMHVDADLSGLAAALADAFAATPLDDLRVDHARLFLGPGEALARPYASIWLTRENQLMQEATIEVDRLYAEAGFGVDDSVLELPDHVAVELEFLYLLLFREAEHRRAGNAEALQATTDLKRRFLDGHLGRWLGPFLLALHDGARTPFYESLAELTERVIRLEATATARPLSS
jgi:TorA maturation chaperone TorD